MGPPLETATVLRVWKARALALARNSGLVRIVRRCVLVASAGYLVGILALGASQLASVHWTLYLQGAVLGLFVYPISLFAQALAWSFSLSALRRRGLGLNWWDIQAFAGSHLLRRLPGGGWYIVGRLVLYQDQGLPAARIIKASSIEWGNIVATSGIVYLSFSFLPLPSDVARLSVAAVGTALAGYLAGRLLYAYDSPRRESPTSGCQAGAGIVYAIVAELYLLAVLGAGVILNLLLSVNSAAGPSLDRSLAAWALVACVGAFIGLVPFGFGIRDVTLAAVLTPYVSSPIAVIVAVTCRLLFILGDLLWGSLLFLLARRLTAPMAVS